MSSKKSKVPIKRDVQKDTIFSQRREMKKRAHEIVRSHYLVLIFITLALMLFGTESELSTIDTSRFSVTTEEDEDNPGNVLSADDVRTDIMLGNLQQGLEKSQELQSGIIENAPDKGALGRTKGVLAQVVNWISSGSLLAMAAQALSSIIGSNTAVGFIFTLISMGWYVIIYTFVKNVYSAAVRRMYLEARTYEKVPFMDLIHFVAVRKWIRASLTMLAVNLLRSLWYLTIIGGFIKRYSYKCVPYIVAENPSVGARDAITLSRRMMYGHKWEYFKYEVTLLGWTILGYLTFGITDALYGVPYRLSCEAEFFARLREEAIREKLEGYELLNDRYLYEKADKVLLYETYFDVIDEITLIHENKIELGGIRKFVSDWFGIWLGSSEEKKAYDEQEGRKYSVASYRGNMAGKSYPNWLNPLWRKKEIAKKGNYNFIRSYSGWVLFLMFISFSFIGWTWEVALHFIQTGQFANRGTLYGPWLPIYGTGGIIVMILCARFRKKPVLEFLTAVVLCGVLEYVSSWQLEMKYHERWWSYDGYFLNLNGRICAEGLLVFGVGCCFIVYMAAPLFDQLLSRIRTNILIIACIVLGAFYLTDLTYSSKHPNMAEGAIEASAIEQTTVIRKEKMRC